jgi:hypothetical protein
MFDKKPSITAILGPHADNVGVREEGGPNQALSPEHHAIVDDLISALAEKDHAKVHSALKAHYLSCGGVVPEGG